MKLEDALNVDLGKWPAVAVNGSTVTVEQAKDIILRTDCTLNECREWGGGNDHDWNKAYLNRAWGGLHIQPKASDTTYDSRFEFWEKKEALLKLGNRVETSYVMNDWASSCYIGGPCGWIRPDGRVTNNCNLRNKWPDASEVYDDLKKIAKAFPYLDLIMSLYDSQYDPDTDGEVQYYRISFSMKNGRVRVVNKTTAEKRHKAFIKAYGEVSLNQDDVEAKMAALIAGRYSHEHGLSQEWVDERADYWANLRNTL